MGDKTGAVVMLWLDAGLGGLCFSGERPELDPTGSTPGGAITGEEAYGGGGDDGGALGNE